MKRPQSMNGWSYVEDNPANQIDPTGNVPFRAEYCKMLENYDDYANCVRKEYGVGSPDKEFWLTDFYSQNDYHHTFGPGCWLGPVKYRTRGYVEGMSSTGSVVLGITGGKEVVYDFATMERQAFVYIGGVVQSSAGGAVTQSVGEIQGFRSWRKLKGGQLTKRIVEDYRGWFEFNTYGLNIAQKVGPSVGAVEFHGLPDESVHGTGAYVSFGGGASTPWFDIGKGYTYYSPSLEFQAYEDYRMADNQNRRYVNNDIVLDIARGTYSPWWWPEGSPIDLNRGLRWFFNAVGVANENVYIYNQINLYSYGGASPRFDRPPQ